MPTLYLVRHGENPANLTKEFSHRKVDYSLTERGIAQAQQTAHALQGRNITAVYASPLKRARETAEIIAQTLRLDVTVIEAFREVNVGSLEDLPPTRENWQLHNDVILGWLAGNPERTFPEGENWHTLSGRMIEGLTQVLNENPTGNSVVVGHGGIFTASLPRLMPDVDMQTIISQPNHNCSITEIHVEDGGYTLRQWADYAHLSDDAANVVLPMPHYEHPDE